MRVHKTLSLIQSKLHKYQTNVNINSKPILCQIYLSINASSSVLIIGFAIY